MSAIVALTVCSLSMCLFSWLRDSVMLHYILVYQLFFFFFLQSGQGDTALIVACYNGYSDIARILLDQGATIDYKNRVRSIIMLSS